MPLYRYLVNWSIPNAGPSVSVFHFNGGGAAALQTSVNALRVFINTCAPWLPDDVTASFDPEAAELDISTGSMIGVQAVAPPASVTGAVAGVWAGGSGWRVDWTTNSVLNGRRVGGRTFLVPAAGNAFATNGQVSSSTRTPVTTAAATFVTATQASGAILSVYHRPKGASPGSVYACNGGNVPALAATLRGRKY